eukprot:scaffold503_cov667-Pavlova_lutheri.AAC.1
MHKSDESKNLLNPLAQNMPVLTGVEFPACHHQCRIGKKSSRFLRWPQQPIFMGKLEEVAIATCRRCLRALEWLVRRQPQHLTQRTMQTCKLQMPLPKAHGINIS